jgi:hypothetical protein
MDSSAKINKDPQEPLQNPSWMSAPFPDGRCQADFAACRGGYRQKSQGRRPHSRQGAIAARGFAEVPSVVRPAM